MVINELQISKVDIESDDVENIDSSVYGDELISYLTELFEIVISGSSGRRFEFDRKTTEVRAQITRLNNSEDFIDITNIIANRLLKSESEAQVQMDKLDVTILKGIVVQAVIDDDSVEKFIICKADHNDFLDDVNYELKRGLPVKKKAFKAFVCEMNNQDEVEEVLVYDTNPKDTKYWWSDFLELSKVFTDEYNTEKAFNAIDKGVFNRIKKKHPQDYTYLRNSTVKYFRSSDSFEMNDFLDNGIGNYEPYDAELDIENLKSKIRDLPSKKRAPFDNQFTIVKEKVKARFKNTVKLTEQINLEIKQDVPENAILAHEDPDGSKYVKIRSDEGYKYFKKNNIQN
ncbi:nucleoid-associated protein [Maribacter sp. PR1]|uniref:Nucleoid-associated protein n=1 Tax=Maribacter cobaltidurans TaxID=1178778 RepID=A0ABU7IT79_9FLAO|nr:MULTISPECIES: nucleoid-associated protein [Maribacter]MDC6388787.1 nucleoid-associated protein [Maribacter sp. PR1]MEE1976176.1 nucleoid-associated protein [Maribacter cobaltidurans]